MCWRDMAAVMVYRNNAYAARDVIEAWTGGHLKGANLLQQCEDPAIIPQFVRAAALACNTHSYNPQSKHDTSASYMACLWYVCKARILRDRHTCRPARRHKAHWSARRACRAGSDEPKHGSMHSQTKPRQAPFQRHCTPVRQLLSVQRQFQGGASLFSALRNVDRRVHEAQSTWTK